MLLLDSRVMLKVIISNIAEEAIAKLNYHKLNKKTIRISWYNREPNNYRNNEDYNVFVKKLSKDTTHKEFHDYFSKFGNIVSAKLVEDDEGDVVGYGFVLYDASDAATKAISEGNGAEWKGKNIYVGQFIKNKPKKVPQFNNVYVKNIPKVFIIINYFSASVMKISKTSLEDLENSEVFLLENLIQDLLIKFLKKKENKSFHINMLSYASKILAQLEKLLIKYLIKKLMMLLIIKQWIRLLMFLLRIN